MSRTGLLALLLAVSPAMAMVPAMAQAQAPQITPLLDGVSVRALGGAAQPAPQTVDDSTLRYYASRGDKAAADAEAERLRREHPGWAPPADLFAPKPVVDEQPLWDLYRRNDYPAVRALVTRLQTEHPDWTPPRLLLDLMQQNEVRAGLAAKEAAKDWSGLVDLAALHPDQLGCDHIDNLWRAAEAYARLQRRDEARDLYQRVVDQCSDSDKRVATLQKARATLGVPAARELIAKAAAQPRPEGEKARIAALLREASPAKPAAPAEPAELRALYAQGAGVGAAQAAERLVLSRADATAARKIGWIYHDAKDDASAAKWFAQAQAWKPDEEGARGLALAAAATGDLATLEQLAGRWPALAPLLEQARQASVTEAYARSDARAVLAGTRDAATPAASLLRGWTLLRLNRPTEADAAFAAVTRHPETSEAQREESLYGTARAQIAAGDLDQAARLAGDGSLTLDHRADVQAELLARQAGVAFDRGRYREALALLEQRREVGAPDRLLLVQEAWARYHVGQLRTAERMFADLDRVMTTQETEEGLHVVRKALNHDDG